MQATLNKCSLNSAIVLKENITYRQNFTEWLTVVSLFAIFTAVSRSRLDR